LASNSNLHRTFSAVRENQMQLKNDELFTYLCYKGKSILNGLIYSRLMTIQQEIKQNNTNSYKNFDKDPLGFVFFKMSNVVTFENKKLFFEMQLDVTHR
jgi:E3 ubiquitin-protein ligase HUWE1